MSLIGSTLGQYRIDAEAGRGGMGVVYRATDTQLGRTVAIKVLRPETVADPDRKKRFIQEAKSASALNHPGIVTVYQIGSQGPTDFIAMEFVTGRSLDTVVGRRPLPPEEAVRYAVQIADALAAAHGAGLVHRDLKPANVMLTDKGQIKLLDFGVAKLVERVEAGPADATLTRAPETQQGAVVGTLGYMSPEQAQGAVIDRRSDIFSFGVLLQEMLTGRKASLVAEDTALATAPRDVQKIVRRCLRTDPAQRFQSTDDLRIALEDADLNPPSATSSSRRSNRALGLAAMAAAVAVGAALGWWLFRGHRAPGLVLRRLTLDSSLATDLAISRDGRFVAYASDRDGGNLDIWVQQVAGGTAVRLTTDRADDVEPSFSPDGSQIVFRSQRDGGGLYVVSTLGGGDARRIADRGRRPRWSPDGRSIAYWIGQDTAFLMAKSDAPRTFVIAATGGEPKAIATNLATAWAPIWSADSTRLLLLGSVDASAPDWWTVPIDGGRPVKTGAAPLLAAGRLSAQPDSFFVPEAWTANGEVVFSARFGDSTNVWRLAVDRSGRVVGSPVRVTSGAGVETRPAIDGGDALAFSSLTSNIDLWELPTDTTMARATGPMKRLSDDAAIDGYPSFTPDGGKLVFLSNRSGTFDLWVRDMAAAREAVVVAGATYPGIPVVSKDGRRVFVNAGPERRLFSVPLLGSSVAQPVDASFTWNGTSGIWDVSTGDKWSVTGNDGDTVVYAHDIGTNTSSELLQGGGEIVGRLHISPNDRWLAFSRRAPGIVQQNVAPFRPGAPIPRAEWAPISPPEESSAVSTWSPDSGRVYYFSDRDGQVCVWSRSIDSVTGKPVGDQVDVWHFHDARHSIGRIPLPLRAMAVSKDRIVILLAESRSAVWLATPAAAASK